MYKLIQLNDDKYWFGDWTNRDSAHFVEGSFKIIVKAMLRADFKENDIAYAIAEMEENNHNHIDFGIRRSMIYTSDLLAELPDSLRKP